MLEKFKKFKDQNFAVGLEEPNNNTGETKFWVPPYPLEKLGGTKFVNGRNQKMGSAVSVEAQNRYIAGFTATWFFRIPKFFLKLK